MNYASATLSSDDAQRLHALPHSPQKGVARFGHEMLLIFGLLGLLLIAIALFSHSLADPAWSTSGTSEAQTLHNRLGHLGAWLSDMAYFGLGLSAWWLWLVAGFVWQRSAWRWLHSQGVFLPSLRQRARFWLGLLLLLGASCALEWTRLYRFEDALPGHSGGVLGYMLGVSSQRWLGFIGSGLVQTAVFVLALSLVFGFSWARAAYRLGFFLDALMRWARSERERGRDRAQGHKAASQRAPEAQEQPPHEPVRIVTPEPAEPQENPAQGANRRQPPAAPRRKGRPFTLPPTHLLNPLPEPAPTVAADTLEMTSRLIEKKLKDFGVPANVVQARPGPVITRYALEPSPHLSAAQLQEVAKDLARALSLASIRVPPTGSDEGAGQSEERPERPERLFLELPNAKRHTITLSELIASSAYHNASSPLSLALGKDPEGKPVVIDLAQAPHLLVAGEAGSGKSAGLHAMLMSLLYKATAQDLRLLIMDPKVLEMSLYEGIAHLLAPVITDTAQAVDALHWCLSEMDRRLHLMSHLGIRQLNEYNSAIDTAQAKGRPLLHPVMPSPSPEESRPLDSFEELPIQPGPRGPKPLQTLPHIVVVIDELADLLLTEGRQVESLIARLVQKSRAVGIHLILATQRPQEQVLTKLLKANIPARIAYQVSTKSDSLCILDQEGAESLLGMGDMLYRSPAQPQPQRIHGAFVSEDELVRVLTHVKRQGRAHYVPELLAGHQPQ